MKRALLGSTLVIAAAGACLPDPVHDRAVERLGPESPNGPSGFHRAGQPCGTCHREGGPADSDFSVAGTVFASPTSHVGVAGATIDLVDAKGTSPPASKPILTNCVGNFWVSRGDWAPAFPVKVRVTKNGAVREMKSGIGVTASCADCHVKDVTDPFTQVPAVYLFDGPDPQGPPKDCPIDPEPR